MKNTGKVNLKLIGIAFIAGLLVLGVVGLIKSNQTVGEISKIDEMNLVAANYVPISGIQELEGETSKGFEVLLQNFFKWGIGVAVILAILFIIIGGVEYMTTDAISKKEDGKSKITSAIAGLILALISWLILYTINPELVEVNFSPKNIKPNLNDEVVNIKV